MPEAQRQMDERHARNQQLLAGAKAGDREMLDQLEAALREETPIQPVRDVLVEAEAQDAEVARLERDRARIQKDFEAVNATERRRTVRLAQTTLALQFLGAAAGLIFPLPAKTADAIHLDYYSAVAAITPVLLVAGFVEVAVLRLSTGVWAVLSFAVPAVGAGTAALFVLATHHSTPFAYWLTIWGLGTTLVSLIGYVVLHTTTSSSPGAHP